MDQTPNPNPADSNKPASFLRFRSANVVTSSSTSDLSKFTTLFSASSSKPKVASSARPVAKRPPPTQHDPPIAPRPESANEAVKAQAPIDLSDLEPPKKRRKFDDTPIQDEREDIPIDVSIKDTVLVRAKQPFPPRLDLPCYYAYPGDQLPAAFLDLCLKASQKKIHFRKPHEVPVAAFWEARRNNWMLAFRSLQTLFLAGQCESFYLMLAYNICILFQCDARTSEKRIMISTSSDIFRKRLIQAEVTYTLPLYIPRQAPAPSEHSEQINQEMQQLTSAGIAAQAATESLLIDHQPESMLFISTDSEQNIKNLFSEIEAIVRRNADPLIHNMTNMEDLPSLLTTAVPFAHGTMQYNSIMRTTAKDIDAETGLPIESFQMTLSKPVLPQIWRALVDSLVRQNIPEFIVSMNAEIRTAPLNIVTAAETKSTAGCVAKVELRKHDKRTEQEASPNTIFHVRYTRSNVAVSL